MPHHACKLFITCHILQFKDLGYKGVREVVEIYTKLIAMGNQIFLLQDYYAMVVPPTKEGVTTQITRRAG